MHNQHADVPTEMTSSMRIQVRLSSLVFLAPVACREYCDEEDYFCERPLNGLYLRIEAPEGAFAIGEWQFAFEMREPESGTGTLTCETRADVPGRLICGAPLGFEEPYRLFVNEATLDALELRLTRDGVEPLAREGTDLGLSGPTSLGVEVSHDGMASGSETIEPDYSVENMNSGPEVCVVCLGAEESVAL